MTDADDLWQTLDEAASPYGLRIEFDGELWRITRHGKLWTIDCFDTAKEAAAALAIHYAELQALAKNGTQSWSCPKCGTSGLLECQKCGHVPKGYRSIRDD